MKLNMDAATSFVRVMKKLLHLISIPTSILKSHVQDADIQALDKQVVLQAIKLRGDYYRSEEVKEIYQQVQEALSVCCYTELFRERGSL